MSLDWIPINQGPPTDSEPLYEIRFQSGRVMPGHFIEHGRFKTKEEGIVIDVPKSDIEAYRLFGPKLKEDINIDELKKMVKGYMSFVKEKGRHPEGGKHNVYEQAIITFYGTEGYDFIEKITKDK